MKPALLLMLPIHLRPAKHARAPETQVPEASYSKP